MRRYLGYWFPSSPSFVTPKGLDTYPTILRPKIWWRWWWLGGGVEGWTFLLELEIEPAATPILSLSFKLL